MKLEKQPYNMGSKDQKRQGKKKLAEEPWKTQNIDKKERAVIQERLRKIYEAENDVIRFCRGLDFIEMGEKITPFFRNIGKSQML